MTEHDPKLIEVLLKRCRPNHMAADLARELDKVAALKGQVAKVREQERAAEVHLRGIRAACDRAMAEIRRHCPHAFGIDCEGPPENKSRCKLCGEEL